MVLSTFNSLELSVDIAVVGAGAIGLACAARLSYDHDSIVIIERNSDIGRGITSRSSEVLHAGIYYPPGSLKAKLCIEGRRKILERCEGQNINHRQLGKIIVATEEYEIRTLQTLLENGRSAGASGLEIIDAKEVKKREPSVRAKAALLSPNTGIVDAHALCRSWLTEAESIGVSIALRAELQAVERSGDSYKLFINEVDGSTVVLKAKAVVNAAGLQSDHVASLFGIDIDAVGYRIKPCKGDYFYLDSSSGISFNGLVYPLHGQSGLGIHVTLDLGGRVRLGPDAEYVDSSSLRVDPRKAEAFASAARKYIPGLRSNFLTPDYGGIRPKLAGPGEDFRDFVINEESDKGCPGLLNLIGIESPGLTAAPAIADRVAEILASL